MISPRLLSWQRTSQSCLSLICVRSQIKRRVVWDHSIFGHIKSSLPFKHWWNLCVQCGFDWSQKLHSVRCGLSLSDVESRTIEIMAHFIRQKNSRIADARWYKPKGGAWKVLFKWFPSISFYPVHFRTMFRLFRRSFSRRDQDQPKIRETASNGMICEVPYVDSNLQAIT